MNKYKDKRIRGSIFSLFILNYIGFTLTLAASFLILTSIIYFRNREVFRELNFEEIQEEDVWLKEGLYERYPYISLFGPRSRITVLNERYEIVYSSFSETQNYNAKILKWIPTLQKPYVCTSNTFVDKAGKTLESLEIGFYNEENVFELDKFLIIDQDYKVLYSNFELEKEQLEYEEYMFLQGKTRDDYKIYQYNFLDKLNRRRVLIVKFPIISEEEIAKVERNYLMADKLFYLFYVLFLVVFVFYLNSRVQKPVKLLHIALNEVIKGNRKNEINYRGPKEFVQICDSFNEMNQKLNESEQKRIELEEGRSKMLADISHDLKTPVTVVLGYTKALKDGVVKKEKEKEYIDAIYNKTNTLSELIHDFYNYSKLDHPEFILQKKQVDLCEYLRNHIISRYDEILNAGFYLELNIPEECIWGNIDAYLFIRAIDNIITNSIKHNEAGTTIYVTLRKTKKATKIELADNGVGIDKKVMETIFDPFVVGDESRDERQGTGLGLSITKRIVELHGGSIRIVKYPKKPYATEFEITL
ncbi:MAG: ATP-binding protein [Lachnospiraceae bacterium]